MVFCISMLCLISTYVVSAFSNNPWILAIVRTIGLELSYAKEKMKLIPNSYCTADSKAKYSNSVVQVLMNDRSLDFHDMPSLARQDTYPLMDFL